VLHRSGNISVQGKTLQHGDASEPNGNHYQTVMHWSGTNFIQRENTTILWCIGAVIFSSVMRNSVVFFLIQLQYDLHASQAYTSRWFWRLEGCLLIETTSVRRSRLAGLHVSKVLKSSSCCLLVETTSTRHSRLAGLHKSRMFWNLPVVVFLLRQLQYDVNASQTYTSRRFLSNIIYTVVQYRYSPNVQKPNTTCRCDALVYTWHSHTLS
jgi:hypothetical protein